MTNSNYEVKINSTFDNNPYTKLSTFQLILASYFKQSFSITFFVRRSLALYITCLDLVLLSKHLVPFLKHSIPINMRLLNGLKGNFDYDEKSTNCDLNISEEKKTVYRA